MGKTIDVVSFPESFIKPPGTMKDSQMKSFLLV